MPADTRATKPSSQLSSGCSILFGLPFAGIGLVALVGAARALVHHTSDWQEGGLLLAIGLVFLGAGLWIIFSGVREKKRSRQAKALRSANPDKPWLWNPEWSGGRIRSSTRREFLGAALFTFFWNFISFPTAFFAIRDAVLKQHKYLALIVLVFPLVGIGLIGATIKAWLRYRKFGISVFEMASMPGVIGGKLSGVVSTNVNLEPEDGFHIKLACLNPITTGSGKHRSTSVRMLWESEQTMAREILQSDPGRSAIPVHFQIPFTSPSTDHSDPDNRTFWQMTLSAKVPGLDYEAQFEVPVFKTAESSPEAPPSEDPVEGFRADEATTGPGPGILVQETGFRETEFHFRAARHPGYASVITLICLIWTAIVVGLCYSKAPRMFPIVVGLLGLMLVYGTLHAWLFSSRVIAGLNGIRIKSGLFGGLTARQYACSEVRDMTVVPGVNAMGTQYYTVQIVLDNGRTVTAGSLIKERRHGDWIARQMKQAAGLGA